MESERRADIPTRTEVLLSSSEALLPPVLLFTLIRLPLRGVRIIALIGLDGGPTGDPGGELAISVVIYVGCAKML